MKPTKCSSLALSSCSLSREVCKTEIIAFSFLFNIFLNKCLIIYFHEADSLLTNLSSFSSTSKLIAKLDFCRSFCLNRNLKDFGYPVLKSTYLPWTCRYLCVCIFVSACTLYTQIYVCVYVCTKISVKMRNFLALILTFVQLGAGIWIFSVLSSTF